MKKKTDINNKINNDLGILDNQSRQAKENLNKTGHQFRNIFENLNAAYFSTDLDGNLLEHNQAFNRLLGFGTNKKITDFTIFDLWNDKQDRQNFLKELISKGSVSKYHIRYINPKGISILLLASAHLIKNSDNCPQSIEGVFLDITDDHCMQDDLQVRVQRYSALVEKATLGVSIVQDGVVRFSNNYMAEISGYSVEELMGMSAFNLVPPDFVPQLKERVSRRERGDMLSEIFNTKLLCKDGSIKEMENSTRIIEYEGKPAFITVSKDITEGKRAEDRLRQEMQRFRTLAENTFDIIVILNSEGKPIYVNPSLERILGYKPEERIGTNGFENVHPEDMKFLFDSFNTLVNNPGAPPIHCETRLRHKDGSWRIFETVGSNLVYNNIVEAIVVNHRDITDRKRAEESLRQSEEKYRTILEDIQEGYFEVDLEGNFTFFNDMLCRLSGYCREELMSMNNRQYIEKEDLKKVYEEYNKVFITGEPNKELIWRIKRKDGTIRYVEGAISPLKDSSGKPSGFRGIAHDITERVQAGELLKRSEEKYRLLADHMKDLVWIADLDVKVTYISPSVEKILGYTLAELKKIPLNKFLTSESFQVAMNFLSREMPKALEARADYVVNRSVEMEFNCKAGHTIWVECMFSFIRDENGKPLYILGEGRDVTERKLAEEKLQQTLASLKNAVGTTIQVLASALEARDPYTAGHQFRASSLACAIASELKLSQDQIEGIRMAGVIHDIGKLGVPAEILSKPTKLTDIEFSLVKEHSSKGYEMLKNVESPWPLADIVNQHHERINGDGYPQHLKGDDILIEARILAVADVVEAIASHRPYRPSLGIDVALEEIEKRKGILYDDAVAEACLKLFREKGYTLT